MTYKEFLEIVKNAKDGDEVTFDWIGNSVETSRYNCSGKICIPNVGCYYICSDNVDDGCSAPNKFGYKNSWKVDNDSDVKRFRHLRLAVAQSSDPKISKSGMKLVQAPIWEQDGVRYEEGIICIKDVNMDTGFKPEELAAHIRKCRTALSRYNRLFSKNSKK